MTATRTTKAKKNIYISVGCQLVTLLCGIIVPKLMIGSFGSEVYGATVSIGQLLSYIALLEGGVGGVARAALYQPLAMNDNETLSAVMAEVKRFFRIVTCIFGLYTLVIACFFNSIASSQVFDWLSTFLLVVSISLSTFGQYAIGISNSILLQAAQESYITNIVNIAGMVINTAMIIILVSLKSNIITVKLVSSVVYTIKPIFLWIYVRRRYHLRKPRKSKTVYLTQKWSGIGQHIAFFLHSNTDVVILTCFADLKSVAVYSVYNMVVVNIQNLSIAFISGMEALFGDMLARKELTELNRTFGIYETIISIVAVILFSITTVMIVPFVRIYTAGVTDVNYEIPLFAVILILSALLYCLRMPYHSVIIAAGHFKQTQLAAYGEAIMNVGLSILLVHRFGLVGVAIGTLTATAFRMIYYVAYLSQKILKRRVLLFLGRNVLNAGIYVLTVCTGSKITATFEMSNYGKWILESVLTAFISIVIAVAGNMLLNRKNCKALIGKLL